MRSNTNNETLIRRYILNTLLVFILGISLGVLSKWVDSLVLDDSIFIYRVIDFIDLRNILSEIPIWLLIATIISVCSDTAKRASINVFIFFMGMNASYHIYTVYICGFNPESYMMIWYGFTILSPVIAALCWYSKKDMMISIILRIFIYTVMMFFTFYVGWIYVSISRIVNLIFLAILIGIFKKSSKENLINFLLAAVCRIIIALIYM